MTLMLETDGEFSDTLAMDMPVMDGVVHLGLYGVGRTQTIRNLVNPDLPFIMTGKPDYGANFATFNAGAFLDTQARDNASDTYFFVSRRPAANLGGYGRVIGNTNARATYQNVSDTLILSVVQASDGSSATFNRSTDAATWRLHGWRWTAGVGLTTFDFTKTPATGDPVVSASAAARTYGVNNVFVGSHQPNGAADPTTAVSVAMTSHFSRALSDAEMLTTAAWIRQLLGTRGIGV